MEKQKDQVDRFKKVWPFNVMNVAVKSWWVKPGMAAPGRQRCMGLGLSNLETSLFCILRAREVGAT